MSFRNLNKPQLLKAAEYFDVNVTDDNTKPEIIAALEEKEVSWSNYKKFVEPQESDENRWYDNGGSVGPEETSSAEVQFGKMVLLKMERKNATFEIFGRKFTRDQPFQVMSETEAQEIIDAAASMGGGFRIANPSEAKSYFG
jgi:hypothetical protein